MAKQALAMDLDGDMYCKECGMFVWIAGVTFRNSWCKHIEACNMEEVLCISASPVSVRHASV